MTEFYLLLFTIISLALIGWGLVHRERGYQYPFFMGSMFVSFILPQAFVLYKNPSLISQEGLQRLFLMSSLCAVMCWAGYQFVPNQKWINNLNVRLNRTRLVQGGIVLLFIGMVSKYSLGLVEHTINQDNYGLTGTATILWFFGRLLYVSLAIFLMEFIRDIIFSGRRQPAMAFFLIIGMSFWFIKKSIPPRWFFAAAVAAIIFLIPLFGANRGIVNDTITQNWEDVNTSTEKAIEIIGERNSLELKNAAILMDATSKSGKYGYGTGYWDATIFQFFPGQIFGFELKNALQLKLGLSEWNFLNGYRRVPGSTNTGIGDAFAEFDYFGCLIFAIIGYFYKHLWIAANYYKSLFSRILYIGLGSTAMVTITHGTQRFIQELLFQLIFVGVVVLFAKTKTRSFAAPKYRKPHFRRVN